MFHKAVELNLSSDEDAEHGRWHTRRTWFPQLFVMNSASRTPDSVSWRSTLSIRQAVKTECSCSGCGEPPPSRCECRYGPLYAPDPPPNNIGIQVVSASGWLVCRIPIIANEAARELGQARHYRPPL